jgi:CRP-like cAMP-binding protein
VFEHESLDILKGSKIFSGISDDHLNIISTFGNIMKFNKNDTIIEEGQVGHPLFIVMEGEVEVFLPKKRKFHTKERPSRVKLNRLSQGNCLGEYSLIDDQPASASVVAIEPCKLYQISREEFGKIIKSNYQLSSIIYKNLLKVLIKRARKYDNELDICY